MPLPTTKKKIRNISDGVSLDFYKPKKVLVKYGYTQSRLANEMGVSQASIHGIINGNPSIAQIMALANFIGCSFLEFFDFECCKEVPNLQPNQVKCPACGATLGLSIQ